MTDRASRISLDPVQVSWKLVHARPSITLDTYSHLFNQARHAEHIRSRMGSSALAAAVEAREGFQKSVHAAALWYSWISPPSRSRRLIAPRLAGVSAFVASGGSNASPR